MSLVMILIIVIIALAGIAFLGWKRSVSLKSQLTFKEEQLATITKNMSRIRASSVLDQEAVKHVDKIDVDIINAKTKKDATRIRRAIVHSAYNGL